MWARLGEPVATFDPMERSQIGTPRCKKSSTATRYVSVRTCPGHTPLFEPATRLAHSPGFRLFDVAADGHHRPRKPHTALSRFLLGHVPGVANLATYRIGVPNSLCMKMQCSTISSLNEPGPYWELTNFSQSLRMPESLAHWPRPRSKPTPIAAANAAMAIRCPRPARCHVAAIPVPPANGWEPGAAGFDPIGLSPAAAATGLRTFVHPDPSQYVSDAGSAGSGYQPAGLGGGVVMVSFPDEGVTTQTPREPSAPH